MQNVHDTETIVSYCCVNTHAHTFCVTKVVVWMLLNIYSKHIYLTKRKRKSKTIMLMTTVCSI